MLTNYLKIAYRNLLKNKIFSLINIIGLGVGIVVCLFIAKYIQFELTYDSFHEKAGQLYRITMERYVAGEFKFKSAKSYPAIAPRLKENFSEVQEFVRLMPDHGILEANSTDRRFNEDKIFVSDASFFRVFSFPLLEGDPAQALESPNTAAISVSAAKKYFGSHEALGQVLTFFKDDGTEEVFQVTGIFEDLPANSHLQFEILLSYSTLLQRFANQNASWKPSEDSWEVDDYYTYVQIDENTKAAQLEEKLPAFFSHYKGELFKERNVKEIMHLQPIQDIHLYSDLQSEVSVTGNIRYVIYLGIVAIFILLIAWINYMNLSTLKFTERAKEVGVRKALGGQRIQLITQFLSESILVNAMALGFALTVYQLLSASFQKLVGVRLSANLFEDKNAIGILLSLLITGSLLASLYPALILSGFKPVKALKGKITNQKNGINLRKSLVTFQFITAILMIAGLLAMREQIRFMKRQNLGFAAEKMVIIKPASYLKHGSEQVYENKAVAFKKHLLQYPSIENVTESGFVPGQEIVWRQGMVRRVLGDPSDINTYYVFAVDDRFFSTYNMKTIAGSVFSESYNPTDAVIINEAAARQLGFINPQEAVGEEIFIELDSHNKGRIVGVVKNYHHLSLKNDFQPQIFFYRPATWSYFSVKVAGKNLPEELNTIKKEFAAAFPDNPFDYFFLDQFFDAQYKADQRFGEVFGIFSLLSVFIACLGLFGLVSYTTLQRTKEIGIRKVLGASANKVVILLSKDFMKLVVLAGMIAIPIAWLGISSWLSNYAFKIEISLWLLLLPVVVLAIIVGISVSFLTIRAALSNPVKSLRYE